MLKRIYRKLAARVLNKYYVPPDMDSDFTEIYKKSTKYTMTSIERMYSLYKSVEYIVRQQIPGSIVECGVWKGGSSMVAALTLMKMGVTDKKIYLYDTFEGMPQPQDVDVSLYGQSAIRRWQQMNAVNKKWDFSPLEEVKRNLVSTGYPEELIIYVKGKVEETIPSVMPEQISLLRLDTDWYESTYHELQNLYPLLASNGVLVIDDYGHWRGARQATDQFFEEQGHPILLNRIDYTGRIAIKNGP